MSEEHLHLKAIGRVHSPYMDKFGIPRQSRLSNTAHGEIELLPPYNRREALEGMDEFSHLWLLWLFDRNPVIKEFRPSVRPPRLGGNTRRGVFATRSPVRPSPVGLSAVELVSVDHDLCRLTVAGLDLADGTIIVDIKPYIPYSDSIPGAEGGFAHARPDDHLKVTFSERADKEVAFTEPDLELRKLLMESLAQDPRPAYQKDSPDRLYHLRIAGYEADFRVENGVAIVEGLKPDDKKTD